MAVLSASKIVIGALSIGVAGSTGVGGYFYLTRDKGGVIEELLKSEKLDEKLIVNSDKEKTSKAWNNYKQDNTDTKQGKDEWELSDWNSKHSGDKLPESLINKCAVKKKESVSSRSDNKYTKFKRWCIK